MTVLIILYGIYADKYINFISADFHASLMKFYIKDFLLDSISED